MTTYKSPKPRKTNQLRIIGGQWRGRKLTFPTSEDLRPTPDRVRETLFNWLQGVINGARCLDLFAGSGALGLEALSRGAAQVVMLDRDACVIARLREHVNTLGAKGAQLVHADALAYLQQVRLIENNSTPPSPGFDVVFLDPPFRHNWLSECCEYLENKGWLAPQASIYLEAKIILQSPLVPQNWRVIHSKQAGQVGYHLAQRFSD